jgi:5-methylcytosine-specific restriction endonuclease McrA
MGSKVAKHRAGGRWSEARFFSFIRSALRRASMKWPVKTDCLIAARRPRTEASGEGKHTYEYQCAECEFYWQGKDVAVDHITSAGSLKTFADLPGFVERLFCELKGLQVLCKACHTIKTNHEKRGKK